MLIQLTLGRSTTGILVGTVGSPDGPRHPFTGIMELVAILERQLAEHAAAPDDLPSPGAS